MRSLFVMFFFITTQALAQHGDHSSVHGMLVVGTQKIYLSHLPMFHSPHDYQALFEVQLPAEVRQSYLDSKRRFSETVYTLVPEAFVLPEMARSPRPFRAALFRGHFERGGTLIASDIEVEVKTLYFKQFAPTARQPIKGKWLLFGEGREQFIAHLIVTRPDFDQVLQVHPVPETLHGEVQLVLSEQTNQPLTPRETLTEGPLTLSVQQLIYLEHGDLQ